MKTLKRNAVIIAVLLFVCAAVYLNWSYNQDEQVSTNDDTAENTVGELNDTAEEAGTDKNENSANDTETKNNSSESGLYYTSEETTSISTELKEYFDTVRLNRKQARDEASETLNTVAAAEGASQEAIDSAINQMSTIAAWTLQESELESMIMAKGFLECVAYISEDGISLTVAAPDGLSSADVARLTDIVITETDYTADQLKIVEKK